MRFGILGPLEATDAGRPVPLGGARARLALAVLLVSVNEVVSAEVLASILWPGRPLIEARNAVQTQLSRLRRVVGPEQLGTVGPGYRLHLDPAELDALAFAAAADRSASALSSGSFADADAEADVALSWWRGPALVDVAHHDFARARAAELEERRLGTIECRTEARLALGRSAEVVRELGPLVAEHPFRERLWGALMVALYREGRQAEALRAFSALRSTLAEELGIPPSPELVSLEGAILRQELPRVSPAPAPARVARARSAAPLPGPVRTFVGRRTELERLQGLWARAVAGERPVVLLAGEPGIGKTCLAAEAARRADDAGAAVVYGRCDEELAAPLRPVVEVLQRLTAGLSAEALQCWAGPRARELVRLLPEREDLGPPTTADPQTERMLLFEGVDRLLSSASRDQPMLLVIDDLHWADRSTLALVRHLARSDEPAALALVVTYRDTDLTEEHPVTALLADLRRVTGVQRVHLDGLSPAETAELIADAEQVDATWLHTRTRGNPFFVGEVLAHLREGGHREGTPRGIGEVVAGRLGRLSAPARQALAVAALIGPTFDFALLAEAAGMDHEILLEVIGQAMKTGVVTAVPVDEPTYGFSHAIVQDCIAATLQGAHRASAHLAVATALERRHKRSGDRDQLPALAHHFGEAAHLGVQAEAGAYSLDAARRAVEQLAYEDAVQLLERGLALLAQVEDVANVPLRAELLVALADVQLRQGGWSAHRGSAERAAVAARAAARPDLLARAAILRGHMEVTGTRDRVAADLCEEALAALAGARPDLRAQVMATLAQHRAVEGDAARARRLLRLALDVARQEGDEALAVVLSHANTTALGSEDVAERLDLAEEAVSLGERTGRPVLLASGLDDRAIARLELGDLGGYMRDVEALAGVGSVARWWLAQSQGEVHAAVLALLQGRFGDVEPHAEAALALARGDPASVTVYAIQVFALRREQGRLDEVLPLIESAAADNPAIVGFRAALAVAYVHERDLHAAAGVIDGLDDGGFSIVTRDTTWTTSLALLAEAVCELGDGRRAEAIYDLLTPHSGHLAAATGAVCHGAIDRFLGMLASAQGRWTMAEEHFHEALDLEEHIGAPPLATRTRYWFARMLLGRDDVGDRPKAAQLLRIAEKTAARLGMVTVENECRLLVERELTADRRVSER